MKQKLPGVILHDLTTAGVPLEDARILAEAHGLHGAKAKEFIKKHKLENFQIGSDIQVRLFEISYAKEQAEVSRISNKQDVVQKYGKLDIEKLNPALRDLVIDLKFRGDYTGNTRALLQKALVENDIKKVQAVIGDYDHWKTVPTDRFKQRKQLIDQAVKQKEADDRKIANQRGPTVPRP